MADSIFIKIDGIKGESTHKDHKDEIEALSWSWGVENAGGSGGSGGGAGKAAFEALTFTHLVDAASPALMKNCATGLHAKNTVLSMRRKGKGVKEFIVIKMQDVLVTSVMLDVDEDAGIEAVELAFAKMEYVFTPQKPDGSAGTPVRCGFDLKTNKVT
jgi:type VI secretion system secreted protein Hcp